MNNVSSEFYNVVKVDLKYTRKYAGQWYILNIYPLPIKKDFNKVVSDLTNKNDLCLSYNCRLQHCNSCKNDHSISPNLKTMLKSIQNKLKDISFKVLIRDPIFDFLNGRYIYDGQPLVFILNPVINFNSYPSHPHINGYIQEKIPASICYTDDYYLFNEMNLSEKIDYAIEQTAAWLLRHIIWIELNEIKFNESWIGPATNALYSESRRIDFLNPSGKCFCGSGKIFENCCLNNLLLQRNIPPNKKHIDNLKIKWEAHNSFEEDFRKYFLSIFDKQYPEN